MNRIHSLDGLRGIAILIVLFSHFGWKINGLIGVQIFFVISGFLISRIIIEEIESYGNFRFKIFYLRRFARLVPTLVLVTFLTTLLLLLFEEPFYEWYLGLLGSLTFTMHLIQIFFGNTSVSTSFQFTWSLGVEEHFYLIWPLFVFFCYKKFVNPFKKVSLMILGLVSILVVCDILLRLIDTNDYSPKFSFTLVSPLSIVAILLGCLLALNCILQNFRKFFNFVDKKGHLGFVSFLFLTACALEMSVFSIKYSLFVSSVLTALIVASILENPSSILCRILSIKPLVIIGEISYTLYMTNMLVRKLLQEFFANPFTIETRILGIVISVSFSWLVYKFYEDPARKWINSHF